MPTYTNNSTETKIVEDVNGVLQHVIPTGSIETYTTLGTGWTKTSDSPLYPTIVLPFPTDYHGSTIPLPSKISIIAALTSNGSFQAITLPTAVKSVLIQVHNGVVTDFTSYALNHPSFHFSTTGHATNKDYINCTGSLQFDMVAPASTTIGYVRAEAGQQIAIMAVA